MNDNELASVGQEILTACRGELYLSMPYLSDALFALEHVPGGGVTVTAATDGERLYYSGAYLADAYMRSGAAANRLYLHVLLHCMLRHIWKSRGREPSLWDLACDVTVESIIDTLPHPCLSRRSAPVRQRFYGECRSEMPVLTAEAVYRMLQRQGRRGYELASLRREFLADDHGLWDAEGKDGRSESEQDERWKNIASKVQTSMETVMSGKAEGGEAVLEQVRVAARDGVDYRKFLRRFAAPREVMRSDTDAFDYVFYTYGLRHYGNMPLIEPPETKEEKRIEDFVIAIDTSMSTSGELVREFLSCTYAILRSEDTFTRRLNIRIMQCDDTLRSDTRISTREELRQYMESVSLTGGSATDFRPVFERVEELRRAGEFTSLRGLIYFTDGMGIYPAKRPDYDAAFVLLREPPLSIRMPPWCIRLLLEQPELERASAGMEDFWREEELAQLPQL